MKNRASAKINITDMDRFKAAKIVNKIRNQMGVEKAAEFFGVNPHYIILAEKKTKRRDRDLYACPKWAIEKILQHEYAA